MKKVVPNAMPAVMQNASEVLKGVEAGMVKS